MQFVITTYIWMVICTLLLQVLEISLTRRFYKHHTNKKINDWNIGSIFLLVLFSFLVPVGLMVALAIRRGRTQATKYYDPWS